MKDWGEMYEQFANKFSREAVADKFSQKNIPRTEIPIFSELGIAE